MHKGMQYFQGEIFSKGMAIGTILEMEQENKPVVKQHVGDAEAEEERFEKAREDANIQLEMLYQKAFEEIGEADAEIFQVQQMILEDEDFTDAVLDIIRNEHVNANYAVVQVGKRFSDQFASMNDEYMQARAVDFKDISTRLSAILDGKREQAVKLEQPVIVVGNDLSPSAVMQMDKSNILAFVTREGSKNSHTAILARMLNIPALICSGLPQGVNGYTAIINALDGRKTKGEFPDTGTSEIWNPGTVCLEPEPSVMELAEAIRQKERDEKESLHAYISRKTQTKTGKKIDLYANIGGVEDLKSVLESSAEGIGLFRSEFLYLQKEDFPSEEEQFHIYKQVAQSMGSKKVIIRTLDIGADKQVGYFGLDKEENPALGYRAIRICLQEESIFRAQLRAILRASAFGTVSIMIPMVISLWEVRRTKEILKEIKKELKESGVKVGNVEFGIMVETPAAALIADELAKEVDFFSIGTNDLIQYTLAIDRQNSKLDKFYDSHHPAVMRLIQRVIDCGHKEGIWIGICGELGADLTLTETFIKMGVDELSVAPSMILPVRKAVCEIQ
ncbi:phosphoenolpyruvate--protein phosphotransferase [Clostridium sp. KNHs216]|uniref:phosphoenolpyruvate--protein phosphotransferase n=1 Tax=Clostridium sp. KNHs216 TaxID=1550235 RepID=UPI001169F603|nr:phosphoenolpyruvate--protein phosphotransferase [Clostridium sp. KNHs216]TQI66043.1 phosphotransferase system enzyme I (PtsI) [Clostridium sp. KNHs216]